MICRMTPDEEIVKQALEMWIQRVPIKTIASELGLTCNAVSSMRHKYDFPKRERALSESLGDPTRDEIEQMCKDIRKRWSVATMRERLRGSR